QQQRVAIGGRPHDRLGSDIAVSTRAVLDDEWLTETPRQPLSDQAGGYVGGPASGIAYDQVHRPRRITVRRCEPRRGWERGSTRCQMQKFSAGKFHSITSSARTIAARISRLNRQVPASRWLTATAGTIPRGRARNDAIGVRADVADVRSNRCDCSGAD